MSAVRRRCRFCLKLVAPLDTKYLDTKYLFAPSLLPSDASFFHLWWQASLTFESPCGKLQLLVSDTYLSKEPLSAPM